LTDSRNSVGSRSSFWLSISWRSQANFLSSTGGDRAFLVLPVRGDAVLGDQVHLAGPDLDLDALAARADHAVCSDW
jgi:hypothetical protein